MGGGVGWEEKKDVEGSRVGHTDTCWCTSEPAGVEHAGGTPPINHPNKRVCACCSLLTADSTAGMGEDCNN